MQACLWKLKVYIQIFAFQIQIAHTFLHVFIHSECAYSRAPLDDSWAPIKGCSLHNVLYNMSAGILPAFWLRTMESLLIRKWLKAQPGAAETVGNMQPTAEKNNAARKMLHQKKKRKKVENGKWKEGTQCSSSAGVWTISNKYASKTSPSTTSTSGWASP